MGKFVFLVYLILCACFVVDGGKLSRKSSSSSSGRSTTRSGTGWKTSGTSGQSGSATRGSSYGWTVPKPKPAASATKPASSSGGWTKPQASSGWGVSGTKPQASSGWSTSGTKNQGTSGWATSGTKPQATSGWGTTGTKPQTSNGWGVAQKPATSYGWNVPGSKPAISAPGPKPALNTAPKPQTTYGWQKPQSTGNTNTGVASSTHLKSSPASGGTSNIPASTGNVYNGPKKQIINNHYHYNTPAAHTPSHYGVPSSYNPPQNNFGYSGGHYGGHTPSYGGMGLFSGGNGYGYPSSGWGGQSSYGMKRSGLGLGSGILIGAVGGAAAGYLTSSLVNSLTHRVTNPWGYTGHGYGYGYTDRYHPYSDYDRRAPPPTPAPVAPIVDDPTKDWIQCVAFDPATKATLVNPNCTCEVTVTMDSVTGQNISHHDCTPREKAPQPIPVYLVPGPNGGDQGNNQGGGVNGPTLRSGNLYGESGGLAYGSGGVSQTVGTSTDGGGQTGGTTTDGSGQLGGTTTDGVGQVEGTNLGSSTPSDNANSTVTEIVPTSTLQPVAL